MAALLYSMITSLDGFVADENGTFDWARPDPEVHAFVNDLERPVGTYLYGRRMYAVMLAWETVPTSETSASAPAGEAATDRSSATEDYARFWQAADKVVYSTTLKDVASARTRIEPTLDLEAVRRLKDCRAAQPAAAAARPAR